MRPLKTALLVGALFGQGDRIASLLAEEWGSRVRRAATFDEGLASLTPPPDLVVIGTPLEGGAAADFARRASRLRPAPLQIAVGGTGGELEAFALGQTGVHRLLTHPFSAEQLSETLRRAQRHEPDLTSIVRSLVGRKGLAEVQQEMRQEMVAEAFARAGSRSGAARLLKVTRQAIQQALRTSAGPVRADGDGGRASGLADPTQPAPERRVGARAPRARSAER